MFSCFLRVTIVTVLVQIYLKFVFNLNSIFYLSIITTTQVSFKSFKNYYSNKISLELGLPIDVWHMSHDIPTAKVQNNCVFLIDNEYYV